MCTGISNSVKHIRIVVTFDTVTTNVKLNVNVNFISQESWLLDFFVEFCPVSSHGTGMWKRLIRIILTGNRIFIIWLIFNFLKKKYGLRSNSIIIGNYALRRRKIYRRLFSLKNNFCMKAQKQTNVQTNKQYFKYNSSRK